MSARAPLIEIFDSIQGEGRHVGVPMAFVRVATCPIRCLYCDTPGSYVAAAEFEVRGRDGAVATRAANPIDAERAHTLVSSAVATATAVVSVTGGEPLVVPEFVAELGERWRRSAVGRRLHLETAALDPAAFDRVVQVTDHLSADYKLPCTLTDRADHRAAHVACVERAGVSGDTTVDVKIVLTPGFDFGEFERALSDLRSWRESLILILQPVTPFGRVTGRVESAGLFAALERAELAGFDVRVVPQTHKQLGVE